MFDGCAFSHDDKVFILRQRVIDRNGGRALRTEQFVGQFMGCMSVCEPTSVYAFCIHTYARIHSREGFIDVRVAFEASTTFDDRVQTFFVLEHVTKVRGLD